MTASFPPSKTGSEPPSRERPRSGPRRRQRGNSLLEVVISTATLGTLATGVFSIIMESQRNLSVQITQSSAREKNLDGFRAMRQAFEPADADTIRLVNMGNGEYTVSFQVPLSINGGQTVLGGVDANGVKYIDHEVWIGMTIEAGERRLVQRVYSLSGNQVGLEKVLLDKLGTNVNQPYLEAVLESSNILDLTLRTTSDDDVLRTYSGVVRLRNGS